MSSSEVTRADDDDDLNNYIILFLPVVEKQTLFVQVQNHSCWGKLQVLAVKNAYNELDDG